MGEFDIRNDSDSINGLDYRLVSREAHTGAPSQFLSLNGMPPGTDATGTINLPIGGTGTIAFGVQLIDGQPFEVEEVVLLADVDRNGDEELVASAAFEAVAVSDCNGNGIYDAQDLVGGASDDCNASQVPDECELDTDNDGVINDCDQDDDNDAVVDATDNCPNVPNISQVDADADGRGDPCDLCPASALANEVDTDGDAAGDSCDPDDDGDGLTDSQEAGLGTDPRDYDTDNDSLSDRDEVVVRASNPLEVDTDGDGLSDGDEVLYQTSVTNSDSDGDGLADGDEIFTYHTDPTKLDTDGDGIGDGAEVASGDDPLTTSESATPFPTLGAWGMAALTLGLLLAGMYMRVRRRIA